MKRRRHFRLQMLDMQLSNIKKNEWQEFFDGHAPLYMQNSFTSHTSAEVAFLVDLLKLPRGSRILDIGCGTGRHSVKLASRGYEVTGVDISSSMLDRAEEAAKEAGVSVEWIQADATQFRSDKLYDAAISLCEGAFCLLGSQDDPLEHDLAILNRVHAALRPGAPFVLTVLSAFPWIRGSTQETVESGDFDPINLTRWSIMKWDGPQGKRSVRVRERAYTPSELSSLLLRAGLEVEHIWGGTAGSWRKRNIDLDEVEIMVVAHKPTQDSTSER
ncbi:MAG: class I SAM-dependent methyltransferase [Dehalococcoidia bacterium]